MKFAQPLWLLVGLITCGALLWRYRRFDARQRAELKSFASENLIAQLTASISLARRRLKRGLVIAGLACLAIALARPLAGFRWEEARRNGIDLLFALDTSKSMLVQDVKPDRITRAKMAVEDLLAHMDGDRVGLIAFAGNAFLQCPLTLDYDAFRQSLDALDTRVIPRGGTDIGSAIREAEAALDGQGNNERILVLLTDGEDLEGSALESARAAGKKGLKIFTVGIGSLSGELVPFVDEKGGTQFAKDNAGQFVKSRLDETMLKQIAEVTGAMYQPLGQQGQGLETIYQKGLAQFTRRQLAARLQKVNIERFQWPLALGLACLMVEPFIGIRRRQRGEQKAATARPALFSSWNRMARPVRSAGMAAAFALFAIDVTAHASTYNAEKAFQKGDYATAEKEYGQAAARSPQKLVLQYNRGTAAYKAGDFDAAAQAFAHALKTEDLQLQQDDFYNLGNSQYRLGQASEKSSTEQAIKTWEQAVESYETALQLKPEDVDAKYNRDLVKRKLEALKEKQQPQQKDNKQQEDQPQNKQQTQSDTKDPQKEGSAQQQRQQSDQQKGQDQQAGTEQPQQSKPDQKNGASSQPEEKKLQGDSSEHQPAQAQPDQEAGRPKNDAQPQPRNPQPNQPGQPDADARPEPGKMSREEAKELLDSLKSGDRKMPLDPYARGNAANRVDEPLKDW